METIRNVLIIFSLVAFVTSCDRDDEPNIPQNNINAPIVDVKVIVPDGVSLNLSETKLISYLEEFTVDSNGNSKVILNKNGGSLAVLMDKNDAVIMMGIISENNTEISVKSTAEASLYISLGKILSPYVVQQQFLEESEQLPFFEEFQGKIKEMFKANTTFFESDEFMEVLKKQTDTIRNDGLNISLKRLEVDGADIRSGIQLEENSASSIAIANQFRRRAHGYLYKMSTVDANDKKTDLIKNIINEKATATLDIQVKPTTAFADVSGTVSSVGSDFFRTLTDEIPLELAEGDKETLYKLRVVGPSFQLGDSEMTAIERKMHSQLIVETLTFEIALPVFMALIADVEVLDKIDGKDLAKYKASLELLLSSLPSIEDAIKKGDLKTASYEFLWALRNGRFGDIGGVLKNLHSDLAGHFAKNGSDFFVSNVDEILNGTEKANFILKIANAILLTNEVVFRQFGALLDSSDLDEWDLKTKESNVTLSLIDKVALPGISADMEAIVQDYQLPGGTAFEYHWSTSGKYGNLKDDNGKEGTTLVTSQKKIKYIVTASDDQITDESSDGLSVTVYTKKGQTVTKINSDTDTIQIRAHGFRLKPDGITINGNTNLQMYVTRTDGSEIGGSNSSIDYKIVWETAGNHGYFSQSGRGVLTTINQTSVNYKCTDELTKNGNESFTARIYTKKKTDPDSKYRMLEYTDANIKIENDENKLIFYVPIELRETPWPENREPDGLSLVSGFRFGPVAPPPNKEIVKYTITAIEYFGNGGKDYTYLCGSKTFYPGNEAKDFDYYGQYFLACGGGTQTNNEETFAIIRGFTRRGYARVVVTFKPKN